MGSVNFLASAAMAAPGLPEVPAGVPAAAGENFENLFAALLGEIARPSAPESKVPARPEAREKELHQEKEQSDVPVVIPIAAFPQNPAPLPLDLFNLSLPAIDESADAPAAAPATEPDVDPDMEPVKPVKLDPAQVAAFDGRIFELEPLEPKAPAAPATAEPKVAAKQLQHPQGAVPPAPAAVRVQEKSNAHRAAESPFRVAESTPMATNEAAPEPTATQSTAPADPVELSEPLPQPPVAHGISVRLGDDAGSAVHLRVAERSGEIHFDVRAANPELAGALRENLPELVRNLQTNGYQAEIWQGNKSFDTASGNLPNSADPGGQPPNQRRRRDPEGRQPNKNSTRGKSSFASAI